MATLLATSAASPKTTMATDVATPKAAEEDGGSNKTIKGKRFFFALGLGAFFTWYCFLSEHAPRVQEAVFRPVYGTPHQFRDNLAFVCACIGLCGLVDLCVARHFGPGRYFALHVAVNLVTSPFALRDFATTFTNPTPFAMASCANAGTPCAAKLTVDLAMGIHLWHGLAYSLKPIDWVHHIPAHVVCLIGLFFPTGPVINACTLMLMGIPGGIDYALLVLVKLGKLSPAVEKDWNQTLNVWMRCPGATFTGILMLLGPFVHPEDYTGFPHKLGTFFLGFHAVWNGCFFMYRTVDARTRFVMKAQAEREARGNGNGGHGKKD